MTKRPRWKTILVAMLCLAGLIAVIGGSYAAYTSQTFQRGVVRNRNINTVRFTSNYLQSCASNTEENAYANRMIYFQDADQQKEKITYDLEIYNHAIGNAALVSQRDITYDLNITISGATEGTIYTVEGKNATIHGSTKIPVGTDTLTGRSANTRKYTITMPGSDLNKVKFTITATPKNLSAVNNQKLAAVIAPCIGSTRELFHAEGKFIYDTNCNPENYDGFNYEISISSGKANGTLNWDSSVVEIDKYFLEKLGSKVSTSEGVMNISMDQSNGTGDYLIPFYIKDRSKITEKTTWDDMKKYITFTADQVQS